MSALRSIVPKLAALLVLVGLPACLAPPLLGGERFDDPTAAMERHLSAYPGRVRPRPVRLGDPAAPPDGLFVDAPGGPVVVHFLPSGLTLLDAEVSFERIATQLFDLGFGSLAFDYPGVGLSRSEKRPDELRAFAAAVLERARELAPGRPIVVRGASLGSMVGATAVVEHDEVAAAVWIAPVRPSTIVPRFSRCALMWVPGTLLAPFFRAPRLDDPLRATEAVPTFVIASEGDPLLAEHHLHELEALASTRDGGAFRAPPRTHVVAVRYAGCLAPGEVEFLGRRFAGSGPDVEAAVRERLAAEFASTDEDVAEFFEVLGPDALETAVDLLVLHGGRPESGTFDILPRRPDGSPMPPARWRDQLREVRSFAFLSPTITRFLLRKMLHEDAARTSLGRDQRIVLTLRGWPFVERVALELEREYSDPEEFFALMAYLGGYEWSWRTAPDGHWLHLTAEELVVDLTPEQSAARDRGERVEVARGRVVRVDRRIHEDPAREPVEVLAEGTISLGGRHLLP